MSMSLKLSVPTPVIRGHAFDATVALSAAKPATAYTVSLEQMHGLGHVVLTPQTVVTRPDGGGSALFHGVQLLGPATAVLRATAVEQGGLGEASDSQSVDVLAG